MSGKKKYDYPEYDKRYYEEHKEERRAYSRQWQRDNSERLREYKKQWSKNNPKKVEKYRKEWYKDNSIYYKKWHIKNKYNLSYENWQMMWDNQDSKCAICKEPFTNPSSAFVDHNHKTGNIRGLLCFKCNFAIGFLRDDPKLTAEVIEYLLGDK